MDKKVESSVQTVFIVSDSTGDLGTRAVSAALQQFDHQDVQKQTFLFVRSKQKVKEALEMAAAQDAYVVYTLVDPELSEYADKLAAELGVKIRGLIMRDVVQDLAEYLGQKPRRRPGTRINAEYFAREDHEWDALKFTIDHDDGQRTEDILDAEVVIVGVSRVRKSQVSKELALKGFMVANVPVAVEIGVHHALLRPDLNPDRVFALTMMPARLQRIRRTRLQVAAKGLPLSYADMEYIREDLGQVDRVAREKGWTVIDGTDRGIEETAAEIAQIISKRFPR